MNGFGIPRSHFRHRVTAVPPLILSLNKFFSTMFLKEMQIILISRFKWWL